MNLPKHPLSVRCQQAELDLAEAIAAARGIHRHQVALQSFRIGLAIVAKRAGVKSPATVTLPDQE